MESESDLRDLELLTDSGNALVCVETGENERLQTLLLRIARRNGRPLYRWTLATGLARLDEVGPARRFADPAELLGHILNQTLPAVWLLHDLHRYFQNPAVPSHLREIAERSERVAHTLVLAAPQLEVPKDLADLAAHFQLSLPSQAELRALVDEEAEAWGRKNQKRLKATQSAVDALCRNLAGLAYADARKLIRQAIYDNGVLDEADLPAVLGAKYKLLDQGGVLSFETNTTKLADVAGLENLKRWLSERREVFVAEKPEPGLDPPKGLLLLGVQGGGKSLAAKSVAGAWGLPLLRLDFAALYNKYYGETEKNLRDALCTAATMAPCVLWIDEIEKGLATESGDEGGPGRRILGTLLTWMAERKDKVFLVATANDIEALPPELLRKGRFDEIFFVDLPKAPVREAVFAIHLRKRAQDPAAFDLSALGTASEGFSGAEIEQAVVAGLYAARAQKVPMMTAHLETAIISTKPLSVVMAEKVAYLRAWAASRTVPAD